MGERRRDGRPWRIAVVGAGPAGCYATQALLRSGLDVSVDVVERLPSPHGLVRYGVAPDHWTVKSKALTFDAILADPRVRDLGNVAVGRDLDHDELRAHYDAVLYAYGASDDRRLGIPGEDLPGSLSATEFVAWYNAHPDHAGLGPPLGGRARRVAVVGMGNVALDVTRMLVLDPDRLARTDMADYAIESLRRTGVREIHLLGRRGPSQASFTPKELVEVAELPGVELVVDPADLERDRVGRQADASAARKAARNVELFGELAATGGPRRTRSRSGPRLGRLGWLGRRRWHGRRTRVHLHFFVSPVEVLGDDRVRRLRLERNRLAADGERLRAVGTGRYEQLDIDLLLRSVGYRGTALPGVPFDERRGVVPNVDGRVTTLAGQPVPGEYTSGWVRRGPSGVIGTNKVDAEETVQALVADTESGALPQAAAPEAAAIDTLLASRGVRVVRFDDWRRLAKTERRLGSRHRKAAAKFTDIDAALAAALQ